MKQLAALALALLAACGGGGERPSVSFYGDSITAGRTTDISRGAFATQDFAIPAQNSSAPLNPADTSRFVVLRYGMADIVHKVPPEVTRANLLAHLSRIYKMGKVPILVNVSYTESGMELATNAAISEFVDIDVASLPGATVDGIHPTEEYHVRLNAKIHSEIVRRF